MRESMEWTHCESWEGEIKVLAVGDSIVWGARNRIRSILGDKYGLTTVVSAHGVNEEKLIKSVSVLATLDDDGYEVVYFNNGLHMRGQNADEYEMNYRNALGELMKAIPAKRWILGLSTPVSNKQTDKWDDTAPISEQHIKSLEKTNELVGEYNKRVKLIAKELGLKYYDAYELLDGRDDLKVDPYHYNDEGKMLFAKAVGACIVEEMKNI